MAETPSPSAEDPQKELIRSLHRLEGHVRGVALMVESGEAYDDVLVQLMALRSAVNRILALYLVQEMESLLRGAAEGAGSGDATASPLSPSSPSEPRERAPDTEALERGLERLKRSLTLVLKRS